MKPELSFKTREATAAIDAWLSGDAYSATRGGYRLKSTGRIAPWAATAREVFRGCDELHSVAHLPADKREAWLKCRLAGGDPIRVDWFQIGKSAETVSRHSRLLTLALTHLGRADTHSGSAGWDYEAIVADVHAALDLVAKGWRPDEPCADVHGFEEDK